jgi:hypothetical protein
MAESLWGDWLPKYVADLEAVEPTPEEKEILRRANQIKLAHKLRIELVKERYKQKAQE